MTEIRTPHTVSFARIVLALDRAPSVHGAQPWLLEPGDDSVDLVERFDVAMPTGDPDGRDRAISCGAGVANMVTAIRALGGDATVTLLPQGRRSEVVATVATTVVRTPTAPERRLHDAVYRRRSYRAPFSPHGLVWQDRNALLDAIDGDHVGTRVAGPTDCAPLADLLDYAARVHRDDPAYQRELAAWLPRFPEGLPPETTLPWSGPVRIDTRLPDRVTLAERLRGEYLLFVVTDGDTRRHHLLAGMAMERAWLTAVSRGLVASLVTQPWQLPEVRRALSTSLRFPGFPQVLLRVGHPTVRTQVPGCADHRPSHLVAGRRSVKP